ncbi:MAG TPA: ABC transporter ATP-binding protein [Paenibacillus sp.]|uniref:ABC transporter ATP-binding protein n=1 Tax=Paenibacillus sp. TaxID=58172 RepID=UPI002CC03BF5|nr:ABC transporter ATP-binding protein [Paenibacillus sp.]HUC92111.1 ABC transporter ATP-binding protein [Paenibacillus sp.]
MNGTGSVGRRLFRYMLLFKGRVIAALIVLVLGMAAQLAGPLIAKQIIDVHILAVEKPWYELKPESVPADVRSVPFGGLAYVRSDWAKPDELPGAAEAELTQSGTAFTLKSPAVGEVVLGAEDVAAFYRHDVQPVMLLVGLIVLLALAASALNFTQSYMLQSAAQRIVQRIRMDVFRHIHRLPVRFFDNTPVGQVVSRIANDTENIKELYMSFMATFVVSGLNIVGVFGALLFLDWRMALLSLGLLPIYAGIIVLHLKYSRKYVAVIRARLAEMNATLNETIGVMTMIQAFRREQALVGEFEAINEDRYRNQIAQFRIFSFSGRNAVYFCGRIFIAVIIWYFGSESLASAISFGVFYAFVDYMGRIFEPIIGIFDQLMNAQRAVVSAERVFALMEEEGMEAEPDSSVARRPEGHVVFDGVTFGYKPGEPVLRSVSFEARRGETVALVGHTGSGKSSIMNLLLGFYEPEAGTIRIDGRDIGGLSKQSLRRHMGIVLQDPFLFTGDIRFNVSLHDTGMTDGQVRRALREVGAADFVDRLPGGLHEPVVERGGTLSAGQRQLISFARALAYDPAVLILDEATSSIDSETESVIRHALDVLRSGRTTFIIAHRLSTIKEADLILVLHKGEIVERGTHDELMARQGRYYRMYQLQSAG